MSDKDYPTLIFNKIIKIERKNNMADSQNINSKSKKYMTPECAGKWLYLFQPNPKYNYYGASCIMENTPAWAEIENSMKAELEEFYNLQCKILKKSKLKRSEHSPFKLDEETGEKTLATKNNATGTNSKTGEEFSITIKVFGPDGKFLDEGDLLGQLANGTRLRCGFKLNCWHTDALGVGMSARLELVQIITPRYRDPLGDYIDNTPHSPTGGGLKTYSIDKSLFKPKEEVSNNPSVHDGGIEIDKLFNDNM